MLNPSFESDGVAVIRDDGPMRRTAPENAQRLSGILKGAVDLNRAHHNKIPACAGMTQLSVIRDGGPMLRTAPESAQHLPGILKCTADLNRAHRNKIPACAGKT